MWAAIDFERIPARYSAVERFLSEIRPLYANGRVEHAAFRIPEHPVFDWYASRNQYHEMGFFERFWGLAGPTSFIEHDLSDLNFFDHGIFGFLSPFQFGGALAWMLSSGGPYRQFSRGGTEAKRIGEEAAVEMLSGDYDQTLIYQSGTAWSDYFFEVAWDHTYVTLDRTRKIAHVILATDTD